MLEFFFTNLTILAIYGDSEKSGNYCEYGDLNEYGDAGESCDSIKSCFFSGDFGDFWLIILMVLVNSGDSCKLGDSGNSQESDYF